MHVILKTTSPRAARLIRHLTCLVLFVSSWVSGAQRDSFVIDLRGTKEWARGLPAAETVEIRASSFGPSGPAVKAPPLTIELLSAEYKDCRPRCVDFGGTSRSTHLIDVDIRIRNAGKDKLLIPISKHEKALDDPRSLLIHSKGPTTLSMELTLKTSNGPSQTNLFRTEGAETYPASLVVVQPGQSVIFKANIALTFDPFDSRSGAVEWGARMQLSWYQDDQDSPSRRAHSEYIVTEQMIAARKP